jgi:NTE family protein
VVVAADLVTGAERRIERGLVIDAVLASAAIPGVLPPVTWDGELLCDGGIVANVPVAAALAAGADEVWLLDTSGACTAPRRPGSAIDVALQAIAIMGAARTQAELACPPGQATIHHLLLPCQADRWFTDFGATPELLGAGAAAARAYLTNAPGNHPATR